VVCAKKEVRYIAKLHTTGTAVNARRPASQTFQPRGSFVTSPITVRAIAPDDRDQWELLWSGYNTFYKRIVPADVTQTTWSRFFDSYEPMHALVAERDGQVLGLVHYLFHRNTSMIGPACYLQDLFTRDDARRHGVGRALIEGVYERAKAAASPRVYWHTQETNDVARRLYDKVAENSGFIQYRRVID
jgi:GNAT superfamily N-acetyltransferase